MAFGFSCMLNSQSPREVEQHLLSPTKKFDAIFRGNEWGEGTLFISEGGVSSVLFKPSGSHPPELAWLSESILKTRVYCGSPCWFERFYNTKSKSISPEFQYALASNPISELVVHVGVKREILVSEMGSGNIRLRYRPGQKPAISFYSCIRQSSSILGQFPFNHVESQSNFESQRGPFQHDAQHA